MEGQNIVIERRYAEGNFQQLPELAAELARVKVDILVAAGAPASHAARKTTSVIPIVMVGVADPVGLGLADSLARPGGNITGLSDFNAGVVAKRLELLREVVPSASRVVVLVNPTNPSNPLQFKLIQAAASTLGVRLLPLEAKSAEEIDRAFAAMRTERADPIDPIFRKDMTTAAQALGMKLRLVPVRDLADLNTALADISRDRRDALIVTATPLLFTHRARIADFANQLRLPTVAFSRELAVAGILMSYGPSISESFRRAATFVSKVLKGAKPADLPVEQPTKFELVINLKTAKALGLTIPQSILVRADEIIQ